MPNVKLEEKEKVKQSDEVDETKKIKLYKALENNVKISEMNLPNKFEYFEQWELNKSLKLLYEIGRTSKTYKRYKRGMIVKVDFGVNIGGEFSEPHFAIVLNKKDNMYNNTLTVIPLSSKKHKKSLDLEKLIVNLYMKSLSEQLEKLQEDTSELNIDNFELNPKFTERIKNIKAILKYYKKMQNNLSYACVDQITTISKFRVMKPINEYDIVENYVCSKEIMNKLDLEIIRYYTGIDINEFIKFTNK